MAIGLEAAVANIDNDWILLLAASNSDLRRLLLVANADVSPGVVIVERYWRRLKYRTMKICVLVSCLCIVSLYTVLVCRRFTD